MIPKTTKRFVKAKKEKKKRSFSERIEANDNGITETLCRLINPASPRDSEFHVAKRTTGSRSLTSLKLVSGFV